MSDDRPLPPLVSHVPGLDEPLDFVTPEPERRLLPNALLTDEYDVRIRLPLTTVREFLMLQFMNTITDKDDWHVKVMDDVIAEKWMSEVQEQEQQHGNFSERMARYCIAELRWKAQEFQQCNDAAGLVFVYNGDVVKSDSAVSIEVQGRLRDAVSKLEASIVVKDYHPHSDEKVWDLVHPSLFPLVYGTSRILPNQVVGLRDCLKFIGCGQVLAEPAFVASEYSQKFQWLPCDVHVSTMTGQRGNTTSDSASEAATTMIKCRITSYINNLHPQRHADLYAVIEEIIAAAIPLWNASLFAHQSQRRRRITYESCVYDPHPEELPDFPAHLDWDGREEWLQEARPRCLVYPEPDDFVPPPPRISEQAAAEAAAPLTFPSLEQITATTGRGLQVIVKLATIELTPDKPTYGGGVWHVEGQLNEHICATALYYYESENITESRLAFRQMVDEEDCNDIVYEQNDHAFLLPIFGVENDEPCVQEVGSVWCKQGRLLTFPNILQHRVLPFELADPTRPGHRKMLALFLVDPNIHIISTSQVPPQRQDWWNEMLWKNQNSTSPNSTGSGELGIAGLNTELHQQVLDMVDFPLSTETAKALRLELMEERRAFEISHAKSFESTTISLCEH